MHPIIEFTVIEGNPIIGVFIFIQIYQKIIKFFNKLINIFCDYFTHSLRKLQLLMNKCHWYIFFI